jgi:hypothetical protein
MASPNQVVIVNEPSNGIGLAGLIFSSIGWLTCGLLCIPGAFLSFLGLFSRGPKGTAIAGLIVGFPGVVFFVLVGGTMLAGFIGIGGAISAGTAATAGATAAAASAQITDEASLDSPASTTEADPEPPLIESDVAEPIPEVAEPVISPMPVEPDPLPVMTEQPEEEVFREFSDATGKFRVSAVFLGLVNGKVKLKKTDGTVIEVPLDKLSDGDVAWIGLQPAK